MDTSGGGEGGAGYLPDVVQPAAPPLSSARKQYSPPNFDFTPVNGEKYTVLDVLGQGGQGLARLVELPDGTEAVDKRFLHYLDQRILSAEDFQAHAKRLATINNPHIVRVIDAYLERVQHKRSESLHPHIVMDFVPGEDLDARMEREAIDATTAQRVLRDIGDSMNYLHARGLIQRDIKPSNIQLNPELGAVLLDLEKAAEIGSKIANYYSKMTRASDETYRDPSLGFGDDFPVADVYGLALTVLNASNRTVTQGLHRGELTRHHQATAYRDKELTDLAQVSELPRDVLAYLVHCLHDRDTRPQNGAAFLQGLDNAHALPARIRTTNAVVQADNHPVRDQTAITHEDLAYITKFSAQVKTPADFLNMMLDGGNALRRPESYGSQARIETAQALRRLAMTSPAMSKLIDGNTLESQVHAHYAEYAPKDNKLQTLAKTIIPQGDFENTGIDVAIPKPKGLTVAAAIKSGSLIVGGLALMAVGKFAFDQNNTLLGVIASPAGLGSVLSGVASYMKLSTKKEIYTEKVQFELPLHRAQRNDQDLKEIVSIARALELADRRALFPLPAMEYEAVLHAQEELSGMPVRVKSESLATLPAPQITNVPAKYLAALPITADVKDPKGMLERGHFLRGIGDDATLKTFAAAVQNAKNHSWYESEGRETAAQRILAMREHPIVSRMLDGESLESQVRAHYAAHAPTNNKLKTLRETTVPEGYFAGTGILVKVEGERGMSLTMKVAYTAIPAMTGAIGVWLAKDIGTSPLPLAAMFGGFGAVSAGAPIILRRKHDKKQRTTELSGEAPIAQAAAIDAELEDVVASARTMELADSRALLPLPAAEYEALVNAQNERGAIPLMLKHESEAVR